MKRGIYEYQGELKENTWNNTTQMKLTSTFILLFVYSKMKESGVL